MNNGTGLPSSKSKCEYEEILDVADARDGCTSLGASAPSPCQKSAIVAADTRRRPPEYPLPTEAVEVDDQSLEQPRSRLSKLGLFATALALVLLYQRRGSYYGIKKYREDEINETVVGETAASILGSIPIEGISFSTVIPGLENAFTDAKLFSGASRALKCEYTGMKESVRGFQTSKKEPDRHWVDLTCLRNDDSVFAQDDAMDSAAVISVELPNDERQQYQTVLGFGGSITEATSLNWKRLSPGGQNLVLELLYGKSGLGYTLGRVPIGSCDFSVANYNFHDVDQDFDLDDFDHSVSHDVQNGMIEMMLRSSDYVKDGWEMGAELRLVASPWSPPSWMKRPTPSDPPNADHATSVDGTALPECLRDGTGPDSKYARAWALYFSEYLSAYKKKGVDIWAVTAQNEPGSYPPSEACGHTKFTEKEFLGHHLGPMLREKHPGVKILVYDYNKDHCASWMEFMWNEQDYAQNATSFIDGVALHWYSRFNSKLDGGEGAPNMHRLKELASRIKRGEGGEQINKWDRWGSLVDTPLILDTEASHCSSTGYAIGDLDVSWHRAERNAHAILSQLAAGSNGWIEWNMVLDPFGGPNHVENFCDAPIIAVPHRAVNANDIQPIPSFEKHQLEEGEAVLGEYETKYSLYKKMGYPMAYMDAGVVVQPMFFYVGHISRYIRPGSVPLRALVDQSRGGTVARTFRRRGEINPGGGNNRNARVGTEVTLWPCEGSTRQSWLFSGNGQLQVRQKDDISPCVALSDASDSSLGGILLTSCDSEDAAIFEMAPTGASYESMQVVKFVTQWKVNQCLGILPLANNGGVYGRRGGAQATMVPCDHPSSLWEYFPPTGEILSYFFSAPNENGTVCLTTGWPFLQAGAFDTSKAATDSSKVVVVLNESDDDANVVITLSNNVQPAPVLKSSIPAHSIQTFLF